MMWLLAIAMIVYSNSEGLTDTKKGVQQGKSEDAYVTLMCEEFQLLGVRVLGQSLQDTGTQNDLVVIYTKKASDEAKEVLRADGWVIRPIQSNNNACSKLHLWNLTELWKSYLPGLVISSIDYVFDCGTFCASIHDSDCLNLGIL